MRGKGNFVFSALDSLPISAHTKNNDALIVCIYQTLTKMSTNCQKLTIKKLWYCIQGYIIEENYIESITTLIQIIVGLKPSLLFDTLTTPFFYRTPKIDEWFHAAAVWNRDERKTYLYLNGQEIGRSDKSNTIPKNFPATTCDIGLKRGSNDTTRGYLKNLMIVGAALTNEEIINMTGRATFFNFTNSHDNSSLGTPR